MPRSKKAADKTENSPILDELNNCESKLSSSFSEEEFAFLLKTSKDTEANYIPGRVLALQFIEKYCPIDNKKLINESIDSYLSFLTDNPTNSQWPSVANSLCAFLERVKVDKDTYQKIEVSVTALKGKSRAVAIKKAYETLTKIIKSKIEEDGKEEEKSEEKDEEKDKEEKKIEKEEEIEESNDNSNKQKQDNSQALEIELDDDEETSTSITTTNNNNNNKENDNENKEEGKEIEVNPFKNRNHVSPYLFVGGISRDLKKNELENIFKQYGTIIEIEQPEVKHGYKLAHIFVNYKTVEEAKCAVNGLRNHRERGFAWNLQYSHGKKTFQLNITSEGKLDIDEVKRLGSKVEKVEKIEETESNMFILSYESTAAAGRALNELEKMDKINDIPFLVTFHSLPGPSRNDSNNNNRRNTNSNNENNRRGDKDRRRSRSNSYNNNNRKRHNSRSPSHHRRHSSRRSRSYSHHKSIDKYHNSNRRNNRDRSRSGHRRDRKSLSRSRSTSHRNNNNNRRRNDDNKRSPSRNNKQKTSNFSDKPPADPPVIIKPSKFILRVFPVREQEVENILRFVDRHKYIDKAQPDGLTLDLTFERHTNLEDAKKAITTKYHSNIDDTPITALEIAYDPNALNKTQPPPPPPLPPTSTTQNTDKSSSTATKANSRSKRKYSRSRSSSHSNNQRKRNNRSRSRSNHGRTTKNHNSSPKNNNSNTQRRQSRRDDSPDDDSAIPMGDLP